MSRTTSFVLLAGSIAGLLYSIKTLTKPVQNIDPDEMDAEARERIEDATGVSPGT